MEHVYRGCVGKNTHMYLSLIALGFRVSKLLVSPLITIIVVPYKTPYITPFKASREGQGLEIGT